MNNTKKVCAVLTAFTVTASVAMFAGCNSDSGVSVAETVQEVIEESKKSEPNAMTFNVDISANTTSGDMTLSANGAVDYATGNTDVFVSQSEKTEEDYATAASLKSDENSVNANTHEDSENAYIFIRDMNMFSYTEEAEEGETLTEKTDFTGVVLEYLGSVEELETEEYSYAELLEMLTEADDYTSALNECMTPLDFATKYNAVTVSDDSVTVNVNLLVYNLYSELKETVNNLSDSTTIGDLYSGDTVKNLVETMDVLDISLKEMMDEVAASEELPEEAKTILASLPQPTEDDTVYTYINKLITSEQVMSMLKESGVTLSANTISEIKLVDLINLSLYSATSSDIAIPTVVITMDTIKETINSALESVANITETSAEFIIGNNSVAVSDCSIVYTLSDKTITAVALSGNIQAVSGLYGSSATTTTTTSGSSLNLEVNFADSVTLKDISGAYVEVYAYPEVTNVELENGLKFSVSGSDGVYFISAKQGDSVLFSKRLPTSGISEELTLLAEGENEEYADGLIVYVWIAYDETAEANRLCLKFNTANYKGMDYKNEADVVFTEADEKVTVATLLAK